MNKDRRKEITKAIGLLQEASVKFFEAKSIIEQAASDEREYYDSMPENMQSGERGETASQAAETLEEVQSSLEEFDVDDLTSKLEEASQ